MVLLQLFVKIVVIIMDLKHGNKWMGEKMSWKSWFVCNEENAKKITMVLMRHGLKLTKDIWYVLPDMEI